MTTVLFAALCCLSYRSSYLVEDSLLVDCQSRFSIFRISFISFTRMSSTKT